MPEINPTRLAGAVHIVNEVYGIHNKKWARIIHGKDWRSYSVKPDHPHLDPVHFSEDNTRSQLLLDTLERILARLKPDQKEVLEVRFGLSDGVYRNLNETAEDTGYSVHAIKQMTRRVFRMLRHPSRSRYLRGFTSNFSNEELATNLEKMKLADSSRELEELNTHAVDESLEHDRPEAD